VNDDECAHVVTIRILNEREGIVRDLVNKLDALEIRSVVDAPLQNAAAMAVSRDLDAISSNSIVNELHKKSALRQRRHTIHIPGCLLARACSSTSE